MRPTARHGLRILLGALLALPLHARTRPLPAEKPQQAPAPAASLPQLAEHADLVALVQVMDTDYQTTRGFPSGGTAFLRVLIPYKLSRPLEDMIEVYEEGLHDYECYFPTPQAGQAGRRFLVFLTFSEEVKSQYRGLEQGCALEALVTRENRYALRFPLEGLALSESYEAHARAMAFADEYAVVADEDITPERRNRLLESGWLMREADSDSVGEDPLTPPGADGEIRYRFTYGIELGVARALLGPEVLTLDRSLK